MRGDRVAIVLSQRIETVVAHLAIYKLGAIALPLAILFGSGSGNILTMLMGSLIYAWWIREQVEIFSHLMYWEVVDIVWEIREIR